MNLFLCRCPTVVVDSEEWPEEWPDALRFGLFEDDPADEIMTRFHLHEPGPCGFVEIMSPMFPRDEDDVRVEMSPAEIVESGFLLEVNRLVLHPAGAAMFVDEKSGRVGVFKIPFEEDPEGIFFGRLEGEELDDVRDKWDRYEAAVRARSMARQSAGAPETYPLNGARVEIRSSIDPGYMK